MDEVGVSESALARELNINRDHLRSIRTNSFKAVGHDELRKLMAWVKANGTDELFVLELHPIWQTFEGAPVRIIPSRQTSTSIMEWDAAVVKQLAALMGDMHAQVEPVPPRPADVRPAIRTCNCLFIGSPKSNPATVTALEVLLEPSQARQSAQARRTKAAFIWPRGAWHKLSQFDGEAGDSRETGIRVQTTSMREPILVPVPWRPIKAYRAFSGSDRDAALVVARRYRDEQTTSTTIVIAGYTGFATNEAAAALINESAEIEESELDSGSAVIRVLEIPYRKAGNSDARSAVAAGRRWLSF